LLCRRGEPGRLLLSRDSSPSVLGVTLIIPRSRRGHARRVVSMLTPTSGWAAAGSSSSPLDATSLSCITARRLVGSSGVDTCLHHVSRGRDEASFISRGPLEASCCGG
jgi:NAD/NADP transhydrogenase beta subunit